MADVVAIRVKTVGISSSKELELGGKSCLGILGVLKSLAKVLFAQGTVHSLGNGQTRLQKAFHFLNSLKRRGSKLRHYHHGG